MRRRLSDQASVSGQLDLADVAALAANGVAVLICNRPDDEEPGQLTADELAAAAAASRMRFVAAPFQGRPPEAAVQAMSDALATGQSVHAYCRSGTRSAATWAIAEVRAGRPVDEVLTAARAAGYDLAGLFV